MATKRGSLGWALLAERKAQDAAHYFAMAQGEADPRDRDSTLCAGVNSLSLALKYARNGLAEVNKERRSHAETKT